MIALIASAAMLAREAAAIIAVTWAAWWCLLCVIAIPRPRKHEDVLPAMRWLVVVPAHNEEQLIAACIASLQSAGARLPYPLTVVVVADNCTDATTAIALDAGATVIERNDLERRGKGYALEYAIEQVASGGVVSEQPELVAFVDADSLVAEDYFVEMQRVLTHAGAAQAYYEVIAQPDNLTGLRRLAFMLIHWSRPLGLARLHLGSGLKGNGMALRWEIAAGGLGSVGIAEDAAMTLALAARGVAVAFAPGARVSGFMAASYRDAYVQDDRWERGRLSIAPQAVVTAARLLARGKLAAAAGALDVAAPSLSMLAAFTVLLTALEFYAPTRMPLLPLLASAAVLAYVPIGLLAARASWDELLALRMAPRFVLYKLVVLARTIRPGHTEWRRTARSD